MSLGLTPWLVPSLAALAGYLLAMRPGERPWRVRLLPLAWLAHGLAGVLHLELAQQEVVEPLAGAAFVDDEVAHQRGARAGGGSSQGPGRLLSGVFSRIGPAGLCPYNALDHVGAVSV